MRRMASFPRSLLTCSLVAAIAWGCAQDSQPRPTGGSGGGGGAALPDPVPLTIATWNVKNFFNDVMDDDAAFEDVDPSYPQRRAAIGAVISNLGADVIMFQEVEHDGVLVDLDAQELEGAYPHTAHFNGNDPRGIDVALLSKVPIDQAISHREDLFPKQGTNAPLYRFSRDVLEVHLTVNERPIVLLGVHFKAKQDDDPDKRLAEAQRTRAIADQLRAEDPERAVLVLGDFNDLPGSEPYLAIVGPAADAFANAADLVPAADRYTFVFGGNEELVDHQMMAPRLASLIESATIVHSPAVDVVSDHAPLVATYQVQ